MSDVWKGVSEVLAELSLILEEICLDDSRSSGRLAVFLEKGMADNTTLEGGCGR